MDQTARNYFPDFDSDWANLGFLDAPQPPNLIGKIHPVFEKFRGEGKVRAYLGSDEEYERILPAIHLASNYLYSPSSRDFIYSLVYANRKPTGVNDEDGNPVTQLDKVEPCLYSSDRMNRIWEQLALHTDFGPRGLDDDNCAITYAKFYEDGVDLTGSGEICLPSRIYFGHRFLRDIDALHCSERAVSNEMLFVQLHLAMALCHEVAHAVDFGTIVKSPNPLDTVILPDPFFGDETVAELGFSFEKEIMGCRFRDYGGEGPEAIPNLADWNLESVPPGAHHRRSGQDPLTENFIVDMKSVQKIFRQEFWDRLADLPKDEDRSRALKIPKTVGWIMERHLPRNCKDLSKEDLDKATKLKRKKIYRDPRPALI